MNATTIANLLIMITDDFTADRLTAEGAMKLFGALSAQAQEAGLSEKVKKEVARITWDRHARARVA